MARLATKAGVESQGRALTIHTPLIDKTKGQIITEGLRLGVDYSITLSCYDPVVNDGDVHPCRRCDACLLRAKGFAENGLKDPAVS